MGPGVQVLVRVSSVLDSCLSKKNCYCSGTWSYGGEKPTFNIQGGTEGLGSQTTPGTGHLMDGKPKFKGVKENRPGSQCQGVVDGNPYKTYSDVTLLLKNQRNCSNIVEEGSIKEVCWVRRANSVV